MRDVSVRELHLETSSILNEVSAGQSFVIRKHGSPVAELRPIIDEPPRPKLPDREAFIQSLPRTKTDSGRILEEERS